MSDSDAVFLGCMKFLAFCAWVVAVWYHEALVAVVLMLVDYCIGLAIRSGSET